MRRSAKANTKVLIGFVFMGMFLIGASHATLQPPGFLNKILDFADSNVVTQILGAALGIRKAGQCQTPYPTHQYCPPSTYPPSGTRWPRNIKAVGYLTGNTNGFPFTDALDKYVVTAANLLQDKSGVLAGAKCKNRTTDWLCTYIHGSLSYSSECTTPQKLEDFMPCRDHCEAIVQDCLGSAVSAAVQALAGLVLDFNITTGNFILDAVVGIAVQLIPIAGDLLGLPTAEICSELGDLGANCNHVPDKGSVIDGGQTPGGSRGADDSLVVILLIIAAAIIAIAGGLYVGAVIRKKNQDEVLDAYKSMETTASDAWDAKTADPAARYTAGYSTGSKFTGPSSGTRRSFTGQSAKTAKTAKTYKSGFTQGTFGTALTAAPATPYSSGHSHASRGTRSSSGSKARSSSKSSKSGHSRGRSSSGNSRGRTSSNGSRGHSSSGHSKGRTSSSGSRGRSSSGHSKGRSSSTASKGRSSSGASKGRSSSTASKGRSSSASKSRGSSSNASKGFYQSGGI